MKRTPWKHFLIKAWHWSSLNGKKEKSSDDFFYNRKIVFHLLTKRFIHTLVLTNLRITFYVCSSLPQSRIDTKTFWCKGCFECLKIKPKFNYLLTIHYTNYLQFLRVSQDRERLSQSA